METHHVSEHVNAEQSKSAVTDQTDVRIPENSEPKRMQVGEHDAAPISMYGVDRLLTFLSIHRARHH